MLPHTMQQYLQPASVALDGNAEQQGERDVDSRHLHGSTEQTLLAASRLNFSGSPPA